jgi:hypothetical protein
MDIFARAIYLHKQVFGFGILGSLTNLNFLI